MKKMLLKMLTLALCTTAVCATATFASCGGSGSTTSSNASESGNTGYSVNDYAGAEDLSEPYFQTNKIELGVGEKYATVFSVTENVAWSSENNAVATVSATGEITAVAQGSTFINATVGGKAYKCLVVVKNTNSFISLSLDTTAIESLPMGATTKINATLSYQGMENFTLEWSSSNDKIVVVKSSSNDGCEIQAVGKGSAVITAKYQNRVSAVCRVTVNPNEALVYDGELVRPDGFENVVISQTDFQSISADRNISVEDTQGRVQLVDGAIFDDLDNDGEKEIAVFAALNGFDDYTIDSTFDNRFAYGVLFNVLETDAAYQSYFMKNQKVYSAVKATADGKYAVVIDNVPEGVYKVQAFVECVDDGEVVIFESQESKLFVENAYKVSAINGAEHVVGRVSYAWNASVYDFEDGSGKYTEKYLQATVPETEIDGKVPTVGYRWDTGGTTALAMRLGLQPSMVKECLAEYKEYGALTSLYVEVYMQYPTTYVRNVKKLVGVNQDGTGRYEFIQLKTNQWYTLEYDIEFLLEHYDAIFNPLKEKGKGLVLLATPSLKEEQKDGAATNDSNAYYIGEVYYSSQEYFNQQKYAGVEKVSAISSVGGAIFEGNIVARGHFGNEYGNILPTNFADDGGCSAAWIQITTEFTEEVAGKMPTVKISNKTTDKYMATRFGAQISLSKEDLIGYKQYSGLTKLCFEIYNEHTQWPSGMKMMKKLVGVNEDGTGVYETFEMKSGEWHTIEFDIDMLIEHYDTIFYPTAHHSTKPSAGLCLLVAAKVSEGSSADMVSWKNANYIGEIYLAKEE